MRVLVVSRRYPPDVYSGTETMIAEIVRRASAEFEVRLVAGWQRDPALLPDGARKVDLAGIPGSLAWVRMARAAREEIERFGPDVVLSNNIETPAGRAPTVTIVYDFNFGSSGRRRSRVLRERFYRFRSRQLARVVVISEATRAQAVARGFDGDRIVVIYPGVDVTRFFPPVEAADDDPDRPLRLVYPSRILPGKGQHLAIEAFRLLPGRWRRRCELQIVGTVADTRYLVSLRRGAAGQRVTFHTDVPDIVPYYQGADIVLFPTMMEEGFGYTAVEAMACGRPVVYFHSASVDEACGDHAVGVPRGDVRAMAGAVVDLLDHPGRRGEMGRSAAAHVRAKFGWERTWSSLRSVLEEVAR